MEDEYPTSRSVYEEEKAKYEEQRDKYLQQRRIYIRDEDNYLESVDAFFSTFHGSCGTGAARVCKGALDDMRREVDNSRKALSNSLRNVETSQDDMETRLREMETVQRSSEVNQRQMEASQRQMEASQRQMQASQKYMETSRRAADVQSRALKAGRGREDTPSRRPYVRGNTAAAEHGKLTRMDGSMHNYSNTPSCRGYDITSYVEEGKPNFFAVAGNNAFDGSKITTLKGSSDTGNITYVDTMGRDGPPSLGASASANSVHDQLQDDERNLNPSCDSDDDSWGDGRYTPTEGAQTPEVLLHDLP
ncbi:uncharacterized protein IL334_002022 [Kwoniella shivajii]|uniref:Uncharacterized protein n=1 Tax=Kwoniella shivajii TaxID=564305 RepID=A0ABZ1CTJ5_9TREE|nr:hypothetical protein IL334_002022 [Kwoniella shivajii]